MKSRIGHISLFIFLLLLVSNLAHGYPDEEKAQLSLTGVSSQAAQMYLTSDNGDLYVVFNDKVKIIDMGSFDLAATQPYDISADPDYDGIVQGLALSNSRLYVSKEDGDMLYFSLSDITAKPTAVTISSGTSLGKMAINALKSRLYIVDKTDSNIIVYTIGAGTTSTIVLSSTLVADFDITDMILVESVSGGDDHIYVTTNKGLMFYFTDGSSTATEVVVADSTKRLSSVAPDAGKDYLFVVNATDNQVLIRSATTLAASGSVDIIIDVDGATTTYNTNLTGVVATRVTNPTSSNYTFISGLKGISVLDENDNLIDVGGGTTYDYTPIEITDERYGPLVASSSTDGYIYMSNEGGSISVVTANPYVVVSGVTYSGGGSSMGVGESATITFQSDVDGTYEVRVGGNVAASGTLLVNSSGESTGISVTASTDTTYTFNYDDNSSNLDEGANEVFVFVTDSSSNRGRDMTTVTVDTPPPAVVVKSSSYGNTRLYLNMTRLTVSDMDHYNVYVSDDPDAVVNKTVTPTAISQPSSGSTVTAEISGLSNGLLYYASVEAVDAGGNVGPLTYFLPDGTTRITATPEITLGPAQLMGETGCSVGAVKPNGGGFLKIVIFLALPLILFVFLRRKRAISLMILVVSLFFIFPGDLRAEEYTSQWWTTELKGGFWMPTTSAMKQFFDPCCNMYGGIEQGFLYKSKYGVELGVGILSTDGTAIGQTSGTQSEDRFNLFLVPMETNFTFRADFLENQIIVPYAKFGFDYVYFRQNLKGEKTEGLKTGLHTVGGIGILLDGIDKGAQNTMEQEWGINDVYFTLEVRYSWINDFGGKGLNLSSLLYSFGLLLEY